MSSKHRPLFCTVLKVIQIDRPCLRNDNGRPNSLPRPRPKLDFLTPIIIITLWIEPQSFDKLCRVCLCFSFSFSLPTLPYLLALALPQRIQHPLLLLPRLTHPLRPRLPLPPHVVVVVS